jgi:release factor glutamine methyltransferase
MKSPGFDVIVSNPPYIRSADIATLDENVRSYDPLVALDGGPDGLRSFREICELAAKILAPGGMIFFEVGYDQAEDVKSIMKKNGFDEIFIRKDLSGIDRVVGGKSEVVRQ